jgi:hypothetical protein
MQSPCSPLSGKTLTKVEREVQHFLQKLAALLPLALVLWGEGGFAMRVRGALVY